MANCYQVVAYAYEADLHCIACTLERFNFSQEEDLDFACAIDKTPVDREGNEIGAVFGNAEFEHSQYCADCGDELDIVVLGETT